MSEDNSSSFPRRSTTQSLARGLGWFSIGLGLVELLAPKPTARALGLRGRENLLQAYGLREIATGLGLLMAKNPRPWLWMRVGGDVLDLATVGREVDEKNPRVGHAAVALAAVAGVMAVDIAASVSASRAAKRANRPVFDYSDRRGLPLSPEEMRGAALEGFDVPEDMLTPYQMRPYSVH